MLRQVLLGCPLLPQVIVPRHARRLEGHPAHLAIANLVHVVLVPATIGRVVALGIAYKDLQTRQSSLEDIFIDLVGRK